MDLMKLTNTQKTDAEIIGNLIDFLIKDRYWLFKQTSQNVNEVMQSKQFKEITEYIEFLAKKLDIKIL